MAGMTPILDAESAPPRKKPNVVAIVLIVGAGSCCCLGIVVSALLFPVFSQARINIRSSRCISNVRQLALAQLMYAGDNNDRFAPAASWSESTRAYVRNRRILACPTVAAPYGYAMDDAAQMKFRKSIPRAATTVLIFEPLKSGRDEHGNAAIDQASPPRHRGTNNLGFADGHARSLRPGQPF